MNIATILTRVKEDLQGIEMRSSRENCERMLVALTNIENVIAAIEAAQEEKEAKPE